jgi:hypothetical protein
MAVRELPRSLNTNADNDTAPSRRDLDLRLLVPVAVTALAALGAVLFLTPVPAHPDAQPMLLEQVLDTALWGCLFVASYCFVQGRARLGFYSAAGFAWTLLVGVVSCPLSGHHMIGLWWGAQLALTIAAVATSTVAAVAHARR